ncbi:TetR family transcriptional regulator [Lentzea tibetensis]|uniref:TetR family transcriptional regulator n=1 Tax=Lentzea tibetensis TaxID=2591470 RepID=A0A563F362_9PSEU|nr:TetR family transcriptional regulator [Lentzea tibetensis]TWP54363.1 TetR family transcriptional regulator [Lentzea tibetensis]
MTGLRERKKAKTRATLQQHALRLFREQGYEATTVSQIAEAAEVSESTFFRYFRAKEDVVLWDDFDGLILDAFRAQPAESTPVQAMRGAFRDVLGGLPEADRGKLRERVLLMLSVPPLRATLLDQVSGPMRLLAGVVAERTGRRPDDPGVRALAGAVIGVGLAAMFAAAEDQDTDVVSLIDSMMARLEAGFPCFSGRSNELHS